MLAGTIDGSSEPTRSRTVIHRADGVQACAGSHEHDSPTLRLALHVVGSERSGVDHAVQVDVQRIFARLLQVSALVRLKGQIVCAGTDSRVGEDEINLSVLLVGGLEKPGKFGPLLDVGLHELEVTSCRGLLNIAADDQCAKRYQEFDSGEANAG